MVQNWMGMVGEENHSENPLEFVAVNRTIHPANDPLVKWIFLVVNWNHLVL